MENLKDLFVIILLASGSGLCIALIFYFSRITRSVESIQKDIKGLSEQINPLLESLTTLSRSIKVLSEELRVQISKMAWVVDEVKEKVEGIIAIEKKVREAVESPAQNIVNMLSWIREKVGHYFGRK